MNHKHENPDCAWCANEDKYPEPIALLTTRLMTNLAKEKEAYIVRASQEVGINPQVIIEQSALIQKLKSDMFTLREQIAREIIENFDGGHTKGENDCSCQEDSDPCYFCGAKDYTGIAAQIARGEK